MTAADLAAPAEDPDVPGGLPAGAPDVAGRPLGEDQDVPARPSAEGPDVAGGPPARVRPWLAWIFGLLCLLYLAPIWSVTYLPTTDGASHLYNSWILKEIGNTARYPQLAGHFAVVLQPVPNWFCYALTYLLLFVVPPLVAEKALVSVIVLAWLGGFWYLAGAVDRERRWLAFLGFPFVFNLLFQFGFWNFCFSVACFMLAVGYWWRHRDRPDLRTALTLNGLLLLCYFSHILSTDLALFSIGVLWLCTLERGHWRRHLRHLLLLAPQALLPLWFMLGHRGNVVPDLTPVGKLMSDLVELQVLLAFRHTDQLNGLVAMVFALLILLTVAARLRAWWHGSPADGEGHGRAGIAGAEGSHGLPPPDAATSATSAASAASTAAAPATPPAPLDGGERRRWRRLLRREDGFLLLALLLVLVYVFSPEGVAGGTILKPRLALYPYLALIPWLSVPVAARTRVVAVAALTVLGLVNLGHAWSCYRQMDPILVAFRHTLDTVAPGSRVLPLYFDHPGFCVRTGVVGHAIDYAAIDKGLVDWDDYEAATDLFPVRFTARMNRRRPDTFTMEAIPGDLRVRRFLPLADYIFSWSMPEDAAVRRRILRYYEQTFVLGPVRLFARRPDAG